MDAKNWIAVGAAGALSLGVVAAGAVTTANAIPLIAGATNIDVPGITLPGDDVKGTTPLDFTVTSDSIVSPAVTSSPNPSSSSDPSTSPSPDPSSTPSVASAVSPVTPPSPVTPASPASVQTPASVDDDSDSED